MQTAYYVTSIIDVYPVSILHVLWFLKLSSFYLFLFRIIIREHVIAFAPFFLFNENQHSRSSRIPFVIVITFLYFFFKVNRFNVA